MEWLPLVLYTLLAIAAALAIGRSTRECATKEEDDGDISQNATGV